MEGELKVVGTPIGNLEDLSYRAVRILSEADCIAAEDTRQTRKLLDRYEISTPLISHHKFNEAQREEVLIKRMMEGEVIALVSDAGMPGVADPGERLIRQCQQSGINVEVIPGPCAVIHALVASGFPALPFAFYGFLPVKSGGRRKAIEEAAQRPHTSLYFESPHRLMKTLEVIAEVMPERPICVGRELTKLYEESPQGRAGDLLDYFGKKTVKGEITLVISALDGKRRG
ncbi:MAG: 16S rRNA (cytidine(1402)-2'-O)-methyltransferase [Verrucomicrobiota bacterium]